MTKPLYFSYVDDFGNYAALRITEKNHKLVVEQGYLAGYNRTDRDNPKAYQYTEADINNNTVIGTKPSTIHGVISALEKHPDLDKTLTEGVTNAQEVLQQDKDPSTLYVNAQFVKALVNTPQFEHKNIPQAFSTAETLGDNKYVQEPNLAYFEPVIAAASKPNITLVADQNSNGEFRLQAVKTETKFGKHYQGIVQASEPLDEETFTQVIENIASLMEQGTIPENNWFLENRPGIDM